MVTTKLPAGFSRITAAGFTPETFAQIVSIWSRQKCGKSHTALTWPEPICVFDFDIGIKEIAELRFPRKEIYISSYIARTPERTATEAEWLVDKFEDDFKAVLKAVKEGTLVVDTGTGLGQLVSTALIAKRLAKRSDQQVFPFDYTEVNTYSENLVNMVKATDLNLVVLHRAREIYQASKPSGYWEAQENAKMPYFVQVGLRLERKGKYTAKPVRGQEPLWYEIAEDDGSRPVAVIDDCRIEPTLADTPLLEPTYDGLVRVLSTAIAGA